MVIRYLFYGEITIQNTTNGGKSKLKQSKDKYSTKAKVSEENKLLCNKLFVREAVKNIGSALILDAETLTTTTFLKRRKFRDIDVPNPYIYDEIKNDRRLTAHDMLLGEYLRNTNKTYRAVWFDYCGTFDGNETEGIYPQQDIKTLFEKKLLAHGSVLAVTFSSRKHDRVDYVGQDEDRVRKCINNEARLHGYNAVQERTHKYKGMYFILYHIY